MLKKISMASSRRDVAQRDSVELWKTGGHQLPARPTPSPSPSHPIPNPRGTHVDSRGVKGALAGHRGEGDVGDGAGGQQHPALVAQGQPDGHEQPQQAAQAAQAAAGAQDEQRPFLQQGEERQRGDVGRFPPQDGPHRGAVGLWGLPGGAAAPWVL